MKVKALKWTKLLAWIAAGSCAPIFVAVSVFAPAHTTQVLAVGSALASIAGGLGVLFPAPAQQVVRDAPTVTLAGTPTGSTTLSSSSNLLPVNEPEKANL